MTGSAPSLAASKTSVQSLLAKTPVPPSTVWTDKRSGISVLLIAISFLGGCRVAPDSLTPVVELRKVPDAGPGGAARLDEIEGRVTGARPGQRIVLFARSGTWWVQPNSSEPFTPIRPDSTWKNRTHLGTEYAALLVEPGYFPPATSDDLPAVGGLVAAVATAQGKRLESTIPRTLQFSGYEWEIRQQPSDRGGDTNDYDAANAWTDAKGRLHLRIARRGSGFTYAEVGLRRSLGYGSYRFVVREIMKFDPAVVLGIYTWDDLASDQNHREMDIEITRWGDPSSKNAQYAIQPYYVPVNVIRFETPPGVVAHTMRWRPGQVSFQTDRGDQNRDGSGTIAKHTFTSGVPTPGGEAVHINLYQYGKTRLPLRNEAEVVIEKFEFLP